MKNTEQLYWETFEQNLTLFTIDCYEECESFEELFYDDFSGRTMCIKCWRKDHSEAYYDNLDER